MLPGHSTVADASSHVAALAQAELPLASGLRAVAQETGNAQVRKALEQLAAELEQGRPLEEALEKRSAHLPESVAVLLLASQRSGRLREGLFDLIDHDLANRDTLRSVYSTLAYPAALLLLAYACFVLVEFVLVGGMGELFTGMEVDVPGPTKLLLALYAGRWWLIVVPLLLAVGVFIVLPLVTRRATRQRLLASVPLAGPMFHWCGVAQATRALAHLLAQQTPLAEGLRLSARGLRDASVAEAWRELAEKVEKGRPLSEAMLDTPDLPASVAPLVHGGEQIGDLPAALFTASEVLEGRVRLRAQLVRTIVPPLLFLIIGGGALFIVFALMGPMITLMHWLG